MPSPIGLSGIDGDARRCIIYTVALEYDPAKSQANLDKHGLDFEAAQALWLDYDRIQVK